MIDSVIASGRVHTLSSVKVSSQLSGRIDRVLVDFNDRVAPDQVLAILDQQRYQFQLEQLQAEISIANAQLTSVRAEIEGSRAKLNDDQQELNRKTALAKTGNVSKRQLEVARRIVTQSQSEFRVLEASEKVRIAARDAAIAALRQAEFDLEQTLIKSPIGGIVIDRSIEPGQTIAASLEAPELFVIAPDTGRIEVHTTINEADIGKVREGLPASFSVDAYPESHFKGSVRQIRKSPQIIQNVVSYNVIISADNTANLLLPGMTALVEIVSDNRSEVLQIPNAALRFDMTETSPSNRDISQDNPFESFAWVKIASDRYERRNLRIGYSNGVNSEILAGNIGEGDSVVIGYSHEQQ